MNSETPAHIKWKTVELKIKRKRTIKKWIKKIVIFLCGVVVGLLLP